MIQLCNFCIVEANRNLSVGEDAIVERPVQVNIDCNELIKKKNGIAHFSVTWFKNGIEINKSYKNVMISRINKRNLTINATQQAMDHELGTTGNYTCHVCDQDCLGKDPSDPTCCINDTSSLVFCGEKCSFI